MEDLENKGADASIVNWTPPEENGEINSQTPPDEEKELSDEELQAEIDRLKDEVSKEEDAKEKRYKEQDIGWKMKVVKEREKARKLEAQNTEKEEKLKTFENTLVIEAYEKIIDDNFWLAYLEKLAKINPELANKVTNEKWWKSAAELILDTKRELADNWNEDYKKVVSEEDIRKTEREKIYHELAIEQTQSIFDDLQDSEKVEAKWYFDDIVWEKKLTPTTAKKYAEMAKLYAIRNRPIIEQPKKVIDKEQILAEKASMWISPKSWSVQIEAWDNQAIRQQLLNSWISMYQVNLMYPL